jgi:hypothetical protein
MCHLRRAAPEDGDQVANIAVSIETCPRKSNSLPTATPLSMLAVFLFPPFVNPLSTLKLLAVSQISQVLAI